jgi:hypothetical protein
MANTSDENPSIPPGCGMWFAWLLATVLGSAIGWSLGWRISFLGPGILATPLIGGTMGLVLGTMQWMVLRSELKQSWWWILASVAGWAAGLPVGAFLAQRYGFSEAQFGVALGATIGVFTGILQWLYLRTQVTGAGWWIPVNIFAWASGMIFYQAGSSWLGALYGALAGIVTGVAMLWLIYRPAPDKVP